jgi:hypothetical protein
LTWDEDDIFSPVVMIKGGHTLLLAASRRTLIFA